MEVLIWILSLVVLHVELIHENERFELNFILLGLPSVVPA